MAPPEKIERVILCSGKVYYDLLNHRAAEKITNAADRSDGAALSVGGRKAARGARAVSEARKFVWCQEESQNMGAWTYIEPRLRALFGREILLCRTQCQREPGGRRARLHKREQACVIAEAFAI